MKKKGEPQAVKSCPGSRDTLAVVGKKEEVLGFVLGLVSSSMWQKEQRGNNRKADREG